MADINMNSESRGSVSENFIDIDPISTRFWCESYLWPYIDNCYVYNVSGYFGIIIYSREIFIRGPPFISF